MEVPMLDDQEFAHALSFKGTGTGDIWERQFGPVLAEYRRVTGFRETNINAFYHHVISLQGPPCDACGKPLRTSKASFCAACGQSVQ
jgi:hypothetical protein